jgi:anti-sigma B factor antagonist
VPQLVPSLEVTVHRQVLWTVVRVVGELDSHNCFNLDDRLFALVGENDEPRVCVDVSGLEFCDSSGIACLLRASREVTQKGGALVLLGPDDYLARRLATLGLDRVLPVIEHLPGPQTPAPPAAAENPGTP